MNQPDRDFFYEIGRKIKLKRPDRDVEDVLTFAVAAVIPHLLRDLVYKKWILKVIISLMQYSL